MTKMRYNPDRKIYEHTERRKSSEEEYHLQVQVADYVRLQYPKVKATCSPAGLNRQMIGKMVRMGYSPGTLDYVIYEPRTTTTFYAALFIEFKAGKNKPSPAQKEWIKYLSERGFKVVVCRTFDQAQKVIDEYLGNK